jgi:hypothetical protein
VRYATLAAFREDAAKLAAGRYETVGDWTFGQIMKHMADNLNASIDGFPFRLPWYMRLARPVLVGFFKQSLLTQPLKAGFNIPKSARALVPPETITTQEALRQLLAAIDRFERETPEAPHPLLGSLEPNDWVAFHLRHAELHMSFVRPA